MAKKENSILQLILSLTGITLIAALLLSSVYIATKDPIEQKKIEKNNAAKIAVLPGFNLENGTLNEQKVFSEELNDSLTVTLAYMDNQFFGAAVATYTNKAFSGRFDIMVGFDKEGNILNTEVLGHQETPGLGDKIDKKKNVFPVQFIGKNPNTNKLSVKKDGGEVDAIATFVSMVDLLMQGYVPALAESLGLFIPLIVVNCIVLGRAEAFASKNSIFDSFLDGLGMGLGFTFALFLIGSVREILGSGSIFDYRFMENTELLIFVLAPGAFIVMGFIIAAVRFFQTKKSS
jgi:RnfABCDGE-type electron transport complex G subunit